MFIVQAIVYVMGVFAMGIIAVMLGYILRALYEDLFR